MKRLLNLASTATGVFLLLEAEVHARPAAEFERDFKNPPATARPWINWFWMDGNITREGITADLEAMQRVGLGGVLIMDVTQGIPPGPVRFGSPQWFEMFAHAVKEATRLGLQVSLHNAPGWCGSGGPWITPELAMQRVVWVKTNFAGPLAYHGPLPALPKVKDYRRDIALLAFPTLAGDGAVPPNFKPTITTSARPGIDGGALVDPDPKTIVTLPGPEPRSPQFIQLEFAEPFTASRLNLEGSAKPQSFEAVLQTSDDGRSFRTLREFGFRGSNISLGFESVSARFFRLLVTRSTPPAGPVELSGIELTPIFRIDAFAAKSGLGPPPKSQGNAISVPPGSSIPLGHVSDVTTNLDSAGRFHWNVPPGMWTVLRLGHVPTGRENKPPQPEGRGLECDKFSKTAVEAHFAGLLSKVTAAGGRAKGDAFSSTHIDSWEIGFQNWTPRFREEFRQRRGYDPLFYLPAFSGRVVGSLEISERFLWDVRRTIADLVTENYAGHMVELAHRHGLELSVEAYASLGSGPFDSLDYGGRADLPMGEFWNETDESVHFHSCRLMASSAHVYGKPVVAAEAFSAWPAESKWLEHPATLKRIGDAAFCEGVNRFLLQSHALQPWLDRRPGMTFGHWGLHYDRNQTWWEQSRPWHEYLARCQFMLQRGVPVADVCYLTEEGGFAELPTRARLDPSIPTGRDYDLVSADAVLKHMTVMDQRLVLPAGMSYRTMVLPASGTMTPELLRKIRDLVRGGAAVIGPRPQKSPSLAGYPKCDEELRRTADELWGDCDGSTVKEHRFGRGKLVWGRSVEEVSKEMGLPPDFQQTGKIAGQPLRYIHRTEVDAEIFFVANPNSNALTAECVFRVTGKRPEFWHPETGRIEEAAVWTEQGSVTRVPMSLDEIGSLFVVFRKASAETDPVQAISRNGSPVAAVQLAFDAADQLQFHTSKAGRYEFQTASGKMLRAEAKVLPKPVLFTGSWDLRFPSGWGAPEHVTLDKLISWTDHRDAGVRYFSGAATYQKTLSMAPDLFAPERRWLLDLGLVEIIAEVKLNGKEFGVLWKPPFRVDVTDALKPGDNVFELRVVNRWPNRLIGDEQLPDDCNWRLETTGQALAEWPQWLLEGKPSPAGRFTFTTWKQWPKDSALFSSGLLGPVQLVAKVHLMPR